MKHIRKIHILPVLIIVLVTMGASAWIFRQAVLQHLVRPALESMAGSALNAEVRIGGLLSAEGGLIFTNISVHGIDGGLAGVIPEARMEFNLAGLFDRRLERVTLIRPDLSLAPTGEGERPSFPEQPPLEARELRIQDGGIRIRTPNGPILLHGIEVRTRGNEPVEFQLAAFAGESEDRPVLAAGTLLWRDGLFLTLEELVWQENPLLASPLVLHLPSGKDHSAEGALSLERLDSEQLKGIFTALRKEFPLPPDERFTFFSLRLDFGWGESGLRLEGGFESGVFRRGEGAVSLGKSSWMVASKERGWEFESRFALAGNASAEVRGTSSAGSMKGDLLLRVPDPAEFAVQLTGGGRFPVAGGLILTGDFSRSESGFRFESIFEGMPGEKRSDYLVDVSLLTGQLTLEVDGKSWSGRALARMDGREIAEARARDGRFSIAIPSFSGRTLHPLLGPRYRRALPAGVENAAAEIGILPGAEHWSGTAEIRAGRIPLPRGALEQVRLSCRFYPEEGDSLRFAEIRAASRLAGEGVPTGDLAAAGEGAWGGGEWVLRFDALRADKMDYLSAGGGTGFTGASLRASGSASGTSGGDSIALDLSGTLLMREVLYGNFYAELADLAGAWSLRGAFDPAASLLRGANLSFAVDKIGSLSLEGRIAPATIQARGRLRMERLENDFSERILPALEEGFAAARGLRLSGSVETEFALDSDRGGWHLSGTFFPAGLDLHRGRLEARGLEGSVPFDLFSGERFPGVSEENRTGTLSFSAFSFGPVRFDGDSLKLVSSPNRIEVPGPASFRVAKGELDIEEASFARGEEGPEFLAEIDIRGIDLEALTEELGWIAMRGRLDAELGRIAYSGDTLSSEGNMVVEVFGGIVLVSGIRMEAPFSDYPLLLGSVDFSGVDLYRLTRTFSFGAINGIADGFIHELRLFRFTPSRFEAVMETREKGTRNISVKALENLTVISQGGLSGALSRGLFRFVDFYRYRKIGIWCILDQDVFVLRGTAREGSERYLVYGGLLPPKIDILAPQHAISFKEMLNRLRRIERAEGGEN